MNYLLSSVRSIIDFSKFSWIIFTIGCILVSEQTLHAAVTITTATGGTISADKASNATVPVYTTLGNIVLTEVLNLDISAGLGVTLTLSAPTGWVFDPAAAVTIGVTAARDITSPVVLSKSTTLLTFRFDVNGITKKDKITIGAVKIISTEGGAIPATGNITIGGTAVISGAAAGTNMGTLTQTVGAGRLVVTLPGQVFTDAATLVASGNSGTVTNQVSGTSFAITYITDCDQFYNIITTYSGTKTISYAGPATAVTAPTYITSVSFTSGRSTTTLTTRLKKAESVSITASTGALTGAASSVLIVYPAIINNMFVEGSAGGNISSQIAGTSFQLKITARDNELNPCVNGPNVFTGKAVISSTGTLSAGNGLSASFVSGILNPHSVTISNTGTFTITAVKSGGAETGTSNSFSVTAGALHHFLVEKIGGGNIGTQTEGVSFNIKITAYDAQNNICSSGPNIFSSTADITSSGTLVAGSGATANFSSGVLASHSIAISPGGTVTVTATKTSGSESGISNSFIVNNQVPTLSGISPSCKFPGDAGFNITVNGTNFCASSVVRINGNSRSTTLINSTQVQAAILTSDLVSAGISSIDVVNPAPNGGTSVTGLLTVSNDPLISVQPQSQSVCIGSPLVLSVSVSGISMSYQWKKDGIALTDGGNISGSNTSTLSINPTAFSSAADYTLVVSSVCHSDVISDEAVLTIDSISVGGFINDSTTVCANFNSGTLTLSGYRGNIQRWEKSTDNFSTAPIVISNTTNAESFLNLAQTTYYRAVVKNGNCSDAYSSIAVITVNSLPAVPQIPSSNSPQCAVSGVTITRVGSVPGGESWFWQTIPSGISIIDSSASIITYTTGTHYLRSRNNTTMCWGDGEAQISVDVLNASSSTANISICNGQSYTPPGGSVETTTGTYITHILNAAGCDSTITTNLTVIANTSSTANISICDGQSYTPPGGTAETTTGTYVTHIPNAAGCDSSITTNLTVISNSSSTANISICDGQSYTPPGGTAETTTGTYVTHIPNAAGCDSTITTNLTVISNTYSTANISICNGQSYTPPGGSSETTAGTYITHIPNAAGCDSTITTNLIVIANTSSTANISICDGQSYTPPGGTAESTAGTYVTHILNAAGCDSTITTNLTVISNTSSTANISICDGQSYTPPGGTAETITGTYITHIPNAAGCDSTITTNLTVISNTSSTANISICDGQSYTPPGGTAETITGTYITHIPNAAGCDSTITTNLTVISNTSSTANISICNGQSYTPPGGAAETTTGIYVTHIPNAAGCDSTITTNLTVIANTSSTANISICDGQSYTPPGGSAETTAGTYITHISNAAGCDSTITTNLTVIANTSSTANISICSGQSYTPSGGTAETTTGTYVTHIPNAAGCDSTITTNLTVIANTSSTANVSICSGQSYTPPGGSSETTAGTYVTHIPNAAGCDSTITTNLTVIANTSSTANISICNGQSYTPPGGIAETTTGIYVTHIPNATGCDSAITTNLTVISNTFSTANISICNGQSYTPPGGSAQAITGNYVTHISNASGCDSAITTNLTVIANTSSTANISICDGQSYTPPGGSAETTTGTYITHVSNAAGCDSTITTNLTVISNTSSTANISICNGQSYTPPGGTAETTTGTYITHVSNTAGCDSTITTNLTVISNTSSTANISICNGQSYTPPGGTAETTTGTYVTHILNAAGCDSTITTNLIVIPNTSSIVNISICNGQSYTPPGGTVETTTGTYVTHIPNAAGCDSTITTNLTAIVNTFSTANVSICDGQSYTPPGGTAETTTGTYVTHIPNAAGCDSTITTNLTVIANTSSTANISICDGQSYTPPGGTAQTTTGTYITHISNAAGCDSTITTNLTVISNTSSTANISICNGQSYTPPGGTAETTTGTYITHVSNSAGCDSTITTNLTVIANTSSTANISICDGQSYTPPGGSAETTTGTYNTHVSNAAGCDSTITTNLTVISNTSSTANISICNGQSYTPPGGTAEITTGTYITHIPNAAGCDSTITTNLTVIANTSSTANISICSGQSYTPPGGTAETTTGTYVTHILNAEGCDSTITTNLTVIANTSSTANISICDGQSYTPPGGTAETTTGTYVTHIPNAAGCDSTITTNLTVIPNTSSTANISICDGQSFTPPGGTVETTTGTYVTHIPNAAGCDSTITTNLTVTANAFSTANISICNGQSYIPPGGTAETTTGTYVTHISNAAGCDSTITTNLTVIPNTSSTANISICNGQSYTLPGGTAETTTGTYVTHIPNAAGCDSTITTNLTVTANTSSTANISICDGQSYTPPGGTVETTTGTYVTHIPNAAGCDSTITTNLTVIVNTFSTANVSICDGQSYTPPGGTAETTTGTYVTHIPNAAGCDSTITTNLTVIPNTSSTANISICNGQSYTPPGGIAETTTGTYVTHIPNAAGCDSTITTNLTVISNTSSMANISICDGQSYTPPGGTAESTAGTYVTHILNAAGCDSTITTNLTVISNTSSTANISICNGQSYTPPGGTAEITTGTYVTYIPNAAGCDSTITTNLTVIANTFSTANISICNGQSYTPPGGTVETTSGTYVTHISNAAGCDSTITTNLTVISNTSSTANISICNGQSYTPPGGTAEITTGTYVTYIPNAAGCDSTITTNLTVIANTSSTANISICNGQSYTPPGGIAETTTGIYVTHIPNATGCDSAITTNLTVIANTSSTDNISICDGQSYTPPGGAAETTTGTYVTHIPNAAGCDSTITTNLTVIANTSSTANISICNGQSYTPPGGTAETTTGTYITHVSNTAGCDSTITTNLTVIANTSSTANISICNGQSYTPPGGTAETTAGTYLTHIPNAAGCDSTITTNLIVISNTSSTANISICDGQGYSPPGGSSETTAGTYVTHIPNAAGCDSTITTNLTVIANTSSTANISICNGQSYTPPGGSSETTAGTYITHIPNAAGCDSTITTNLTVIENTSSTANISICNGQSYTPPGGSSETTAGTYITHIPNAAGCDSTITTNLTVIANTSSTANISICNGQSYTPPGGIAETTTGIYVTHIPNATGCDSAITTNLTVIANTSSTDNISICDGQSYTPPGGAAETTTGTYVTHIPNVAGCDSTITTNLTVIANTSSTANISICNGQSYTPPGGTAETTTGTYVTHIPNAAGCDSTITTNLTVIPNTSSTANISICNGQSYTPPGGSSETTAGTYITHIPNAAGCDSTITTNLTVIENTFSTANISICDGQSYTPPGGTAETTTGTYVTHIPNAAGCDSTISTNLTVVANTSSTANISICDGQSYTPPGGSVETTTGTYITHISNTAGCDSTITTNLIVIANTSSTANISICNGQSYTPPGGTAETTTGTYVTHIPNAAGCDSSITTNLTVTANTSSTANISICDGQSYTPPSGTAETTTGTYITHIPNAAGCDSTITTNLTVISNTSSTANISICNGQSYTPPGGTAETTTGTYVTHIPNAAGCDSTISTNLTVVANTSSTANISICDGQSYTPPGGTAETTTGTYVTHITNAAGCDSTITTNLTLITNTSSTANISICDGQSYTPPGGSPETTAGTYLTHSPNAAGCDSLITTNLTVIENSSDTTNVSICEGQSYSLPGGGSEEFSGTYITTIPNASGCDSVITTNLTVIPNTSSSSNIEICGGQSYTPPGGSAQTTTGSYVTIISNTAGCDSTITTNLFVNANTSSNANITICNGQSYTPPGGSIQTTSGTYLTHIPNADGCDSAITTNLSVVSSTSNTANISICSGQSYTPPGGSMETTSGTYITHISNSAGCDSTITTNLTVVPNTTSTANISICSGQTYTPPGGSAEAATGTYVTHISNADGCDSTITTNLTVIPNTTSTANISICEGQSYTLPGSASQNVSGTYISHVVNAGGCDSSITTILNVVQNTNSTMNIAIDADSSYTPPGGTPQNTSGTYITHIPNAAGCDSMITTNLSVGLNTASSSYITICDGQSYTLPDAIVIDSSGTYISIVPNAAGFDSVITTFLTVISNSSNSVNISICSGQSYTPPGGTAQNTTGTYITHISNQIGCDSVITTNLVVIQNSSSTANVTICSGQSYTPPGGSVQNASGTYITHISNSAGCDSTITTILSVSPNPVLTTISNPSSCSGANGSVILNASGGTSPYTFTGANTTSLSPGVYVYTVTDANGCTSSNSATVGTIASSLALNINAQQIACFGGKGAVTLSASGGTPPYVYINPVTTNLISGTYTYTVTDGSGCSKTNSATINPAPAQLILTATPHQILCFGGKGSVTLSASGGTPNYTFSGAATLNLAAGNYQYTVTDSKGCKATKPATISQAPASIGGSISTTNSNCGIGTGTASVVVRGGIGPYTFTWNTIPVQTSRIATNLSAGTYTVRINDVNGCSGSAVAIVRQNLPTAVTITGLNTICPGGSVTLTATQGLSSYLWNTGDTTPSIRVSSVSSYIVTATNTSNCTSTATKNMINGVIPSNTITGQDYLCPNGAINLCAPAGMTSYVWSNGTRTQCASIRNGGTYTVSITNSGGCSSIGTKTVKMPMRITSTSTNGICNNGFLGSAAVAVTGDTGPFTYAWNNSATTQNIGGLNAGIYTVTVTDSYGCTTTASKTVLVNKVSTDFSVVNSFFMDRDIVPETNIWFSSVVKVNYSGSYPLTIRFINQNIVSTRFNLAPSNAQLVLTNAVTEATTVFNGTEWVTTAPPNLTGQYFISGYSYPVTSVINRNLNPVTWKGIWVASCPGVSTVEWKWSAAVYSYFISGLDSLGVKPIDGPTQSQYNNNDPAGTPENFKPYCVIGARGGGGTSYVGSYTGVGRRGPCAPLSCSAGSGAMVSKISVNQIEEIDSRVSVAVYPNPFSSKLTIDFRRNEKSGHTTIVLYSLSGEKVASIYDDETEADTDYKIEFNGETLPDGIYMYKIISGEEVINGRIILLK